MTTRAALWLGLAASLILLAFTKKEQIATGVKNMMTPRGIRNNNPGNIRHSGSHWQGQAATQTDPDFVQFVTPEYGIRALAKLLGTYSTQGLDTVRKIISKYAPSNENNTDAYAQAVARALGVTPDTKIDVNARKDVLVKAIIAHENGQQPYSVAQINTGVMMA